MKKSLTLLTLLLVISISANAGRCKAITHAGTQCTRTAKVQGYCTQHYKILKKQQKDPEYENKVKENYESDGKPKKAANEKERCNAKTKKGTRCKLKVGKGTKLCPGHTK